MHFMIGKHYLKYFPREVTRLETGLTIYDSVFESYDKSTGLVSGPHPQFTKVRRIAHFAHDRKLSYDTQEAQTCIALSSLDSVPLIGPREPLVDADLVQLFPGYSCTREQLKSPNFHSIFSSLKTPSRILSKRSSIISF